VAMRDQDVRLAITPAQARAANVQQRQRLAQTLRDLPASQWASPTRCAGWSVQDVVRHLAQMNGVFLDALGAAQAGERFDGFRTFEPKRTPDVWVRELRGVSAVQTLADFEASTEAVLAASTALDADGATKVATPAGRQPWPRAMLHSLFDSAVHERDILLAIGEPAVRGADLATVAAYQVLLSARIACASGASLDAVLRLSDDVTIGVSVTGPVVSVALDAPDEAGAMVGTGDSVATLDAMVGRGVLADVLEAPPNVLSALSGLVALV